MEDENNYYKSSGGIIPVKWTAPEVKRFTQHTVHSLHTLLFQYDNNNHIL